MHQTQDDAQGEQSFNSGASMCDFINDIEFQPLWGGDEEKECGHAWETCTKYPGHEGFIPLPDFTLQHLPQRFQSEDVLDYIKAHADLTVRLRIKASPERSRTDQFAQGGGFTGTAYVSIVDEQDKDCFCKECKTHGYKDRKWWRIALRSATHCIVDEYEAENVRVDFFFDSKEAQRAGKIKTLRGVRMLIALRTMDLCEMECATHDEALASFLEEREMKMVQLSCTLELRPTSSSSETTTTTTTTTATTKTTMDNNKVMVCVSHPHGRPKQVTVGELVNRYNVDSKRPAVAGLQTSQQYVDYTTRTCQGSSGARVVCLDFLFSQDVLESLASDFTHQKGDRERGVNTGCGEGKNSNEGFKSVEEWREILFQEDGTLRDDFYGGSGRDDEETRRFTIEGYEGPLAWVD